MKQLSFIRGGELWRIVIREREISFILPLLNNVPLTINLDKLDEHREDIVKMKMDDETLEELSQLETEEDMAKDITSDLRIMGWRLLRTNGDC